MTTDRERAADPLHAALTRMAPGTPLRDALERILRARTGALIVVGEGPGVEPIISGGFRIDEEFTAQRLAELSKMDGAIVLSGDGGRILRANVHLVPNSSIPTLESGTRHRTAERVAKQTGLPVVSVSQSMRMVTVYLNSSKRVLEDTPALIARADQAIQTLARYKQRLDEVAATLSALEVEDLVTLRDALVFVQRMEMVCRIATEVEGLVAELGTEGRLLRLQLDELMGGVEPDRRCVVQDYYVPRRGRSLDGALRDLAHLSPEELLDPQALARVLNHPPGPEALDGPVSPRGFRLLSKIPRLPGPVVERIVGKFGRLPKVMGASIEALLAVEGVGATRAASIKDGLARLAELSIIDRRL